MPNELEPLKPARAREMYLDARSHELADATIQSHGYRLKQFVQWCDEDGIENLNSLTGRDIHRFRVTRREEDGCSTSTMKGQLATLRVFLRFCESIDGVRPGLDEKIILPTPTEEDARDEMLAVEQAETLLDYLNQFRYAQLEHVLIHVLWNTGLRIGAAVGLDISDYDSAEQYLELVHRPEQGTPLKNGAQAERFVAIGDSTSAILDDWLAHAHPGVLDDYEREPLFATRNGRLSRNRGRSIAYESTRPCVYTNECPHDRDIEDCEASGDRAYACPSSLSPHPIRRGSITHHLQSDVPEQVVSDRMDVGLKVIDRHYDQRTEREKLRQRRQYLPD